MTSGATLLKGDYFLAPIDVAVIDVITWRSSGAAARRTS